MSVLATRPRPPKMVEIADRVFAFTQPDGGWCLSNSGLLASDEGVVVIDTAATEIRAARLRRAVDELPAGHSRVVVNTHHHGDHTFGNHLFGAATTIIGHERARDEMIDTGLALTRLWPDVEWGDVRVTPPTVVFRDQLTLHFGTRRAELIFVGPAHTTNDVVVWLPDDAVLFAGDVVLSGCTPFNLMGSIAGSLAAVRRLRRLDPKTVVGGHGPVGGAELFDQTEAYLQWVQELSFAGEAAGLTPLEAARQADLGAFADLVDPERLVGNLHRAYAELAGGELGAPLDVAAAFAQMIEYNGGVLPECLA